ncbi:MAG: ArsR family transcriptional regulator [Sandaracinus sp.]|nr:ArsR family transcriptional regulator [Sandaracinus sp.]
MTPDDALEIKNGEVAAIAQALGTPVRLAMLGLLDQRPHSVTELADKLGQSKANTSAQLKVLNAAGLVESEREGRQVFSRLASAQVRALLGALQGTAVAHSARMRELVRTFYELPEQWSPVTLRELRRRVREGEVVLLDVRPRDEHEHGHLRGALSIPHDEIEARMAELPADAPVVVGCRGRYCVLAAAATRAVAGSGRQVTNLGASPRALAAQGFPWVGA